MNADKNLGRNNADADRNAFTLTELLVIVATVGILAAVVLPALAGTKTDSKSFQCMNNLKQLATAWILYSDESNDRVVDLCTYEVSRGISPVSNNAREGVPWRTSISAMSPPPLPAGIPAGSQAAQKFLIEWGFERPAPNIAGPLYGFVPNPDIIHCPADWRANLAIKYQPYGGPFAWDSYSGSAYLNGEAGGFTKRSQILHPSGRFLWTEASDMRGENLGSLEMNIYGSLKDQGGPFHAAQFSDSPGAFHVAAANFNFCDGHVENHKWQDHTTIAFANDTTTDKNDGGATRTAAQHTGNVDAIWVASHYAGPQNP
jgi:prepilin-type processing-associated H-X9-DG protein